MNGACQRFEALLHEQLIPEFCDSRGFEPENYRASNKVTDRDALDFLRAWDGGLITPVGRGLYRTSKSAAGEQFFWSGRKRVEPRRFSLWLEPVITIAALARLHLDFEWPSEHIGTQSADWAFDVVAYFPGSDEEAVAGEVKKTVSEVDQLIELMKMHGELSTAEAPRSGKQRNAFKKVAALRARKAPVLWVLGPGAYERVFNVSYLADLRVVLNDATRGDLHFARFSGSKGGEPPQL